MGKVGPAERDLLRLGTYPVPRRSGPSDRVVQLKTTHMRAAGHLFRRASRHLAAGDRLLDGPTFTSRWHYWRPLLVACCRTFRMTGSPGRRASP